ncbi:MAG: hypothetical protein WA989_10735 [Henriciella sp.]|uniref:hypothetical protein n=1 Tax=Henriciella sp. TaxID=1968823 RepID=UPI003C70954A
MKISRTIGACLIAASMGLSALAEEEGAIAPAMVGELADFSQAEKKAYAVGVVQTMTYLTATTSEDYEKAACIAGQEKLAYRTLLEADPDDPAALAIEMAVTEACDEVEAPGTGTLLRAEDVDTWFGAETPEMERALFVYALSDTLFFRVFTRVEDTVADCVHEMSQIAMSPDNEFSRQFLAEPSDPLVADLIDRPVSVCLE